MKQKNNHCICIKSLKSFNDRFLRNLYTDFDMLSLNCLTILSFATILIILDLFTLRTICHNVHKDISLFFTDGTTSKQCETSCHYCGSSKHIANVTFNIPLHYPRIKASNIP